MSHSYRPDPDDPPAAHVTDENEIYDLELSGTLDEQGGRLIPDWMLPEVDRIVGTYMYRSQWFSFDRVPPMSWQDLAKGRFWSRRSRVKWAIHNFLFRDCYGQDYE